MTLSDEELEFLKILSEENFLTDYANWVESMELHLSLTQVR